ncbi:MAG: hypothetical protein R2698_01060 [Microthrixaceae bacterium]
MTNLDVWSTGRDVRRRLVELALLSGSVVAADVVLLDSTHLGSTGREAC